MLLIALRIYVLLGDIQKVCSPKIPVFCLPPRSPHFVYPCSFSGTPLPHSSPYPKVRWLWLEITLSSSISLRVKFREKKLIMNTTIFG